MWLYYAAIALTIVSNVFYHFIQKSTPNNINPILSLFISYLTAAVACAALLPFYPYEEGIIPSLKKINWTSFALGISLIGLELGFLLAYRSGWNISSAAFLSNATVTMLLIPIGVLLFQEKITLTTIAGIILCLGGIILINHK
jgi:drug/metabolite transporter (DMT)-like permease